MVVVILHNTYIYVMHIFLKSFLNVLEGKFISTPCYSLKCIAFHILADLLRQTTSQLLWEAFSHAAINAPICTQISTPIYSQVSFIQLSELVL